MSSDFKTRLKQLVGDTQPFAWAAKVGISKGAFSRIWHEGAVPKYEHLLKIKHSTGASLDWLLAGEGLPPDSVLRIESKKMDSLDAMKKGDLKKVDKINNEINELKVQYLASLPQKRYQTVAFEVTEEERSELVYEVTLAAENALGDEGVQMEPEKKAKFIRLLYEHYLKEWVKWKEGGKKPDLSNVIDFAKVAGL